MLRLSACARMAAAKGSQAAKMSRKRLRCRRRQLLGWHLMDPEPTSSYGYGCGLVWVWARRGPLLVAHALHGTICKRTMSAMISSRDLHATSQNYGRLHTRSTGQISRPLAIPLP